MSHRENINSLNGYLYSSEVLKSRLLITLLCRAQRVSKKVIKVVDPKANEQSLWSFSILRLICAVSVGFQNPL